MPVRGLVKRSVIPCTSQNEAEDICRDNDCGEIPRAMTGEDRIEYEHRKVRECIDKLELIPVTSGAFDVETEVFS